MTLYSCKQDDVYHDLSNDAKDLILFEVDDTFRLKNLETNEIITLTVIQKTIEYYNTSSSNYFISFGSGGNVYVEHGEYIFRDSTNSYWGTVTVEANTDGSFKFDAYLGDGFVNTYYPFDYQDEFFSTIDVEGIEYSNAYLLRSSPDILFYSKEKGILKIVDDFSQETRFTIVE
jgi:hypothetical protein